jgi:ATP-dependent DNA helicase RecQ
MNSPQLLPLLKQHFGFDTFRPLQEEIIRDSLADKDVFALLPTGGGKSLCFQLPALARPGLTLVISPLIALMKDQVDQLQTSGIAATFLNSSLEPNQARKRVAELHGGNYRLLYVAPERAMLTQFLNDIKNWNVNLIAVDEAHCISEWGHDFRPEYRQLVELRKLMPKVPFMALTATATTRVREDIIRYLQLNKPSCYVASFNRPNLSYKVVPKVSPYEQVLAFIRARKNESGIVYCFSRKSADSVAERLVADGISAKPYHAGMEKDDRTRNQELFLRDEVQVICATIAFGMGINKSNVRFIIHHDLPKNIEGYYQETGRAGRDGLPSDCLLLYSNSDVMKQLHFIEEKDAIEQRVARAQLDKIVEYAESLNCRRVMLLEYFGEFYSEPMCNGCDNCLAPRDKYDATIPAQKLLSCVARIKEQSGYTTGLNYIVEVLTGADTEDVRKRNHKSLSTYGIGKDTSRKEWLEIGRELMRLRYLKLSDGEFRVVELTPLAMKALKERQPILLTKSPKIEQRVMEPSGEYDEVLFERLRVLRKQFADERNVPAFVIFSDAALRQMARTYPTREHEFIRISGVGEKKLKDFGESFMEEIQEHLAVNAKRTYTDAPVVAAPAKPKMSETAQETLRLFRLGKSIEEIASHRELTVGTIGGHLFTAVSCGEGVDLNRLMTADEQQQAADAFAKLGFANLTGVYELLEQKISYAALRIFRVVKQKLEDGSQKSEIGNQNPKPKAE